MSIRKCFTSYKTRGKLFNGMTEKIIIEGVECEIYNFERQYGEDSNDWAPCWCISIKNNGTISEYYGSENDLDAKQCAIDDAISFLKKFPQKNNNI